MPNILFNQYQKQADVNAVNKALNAWLDKGNMIDESPNETQNKKQSLFDEQTVKKMTREKLQNELLLAINDGRVEDCLMILKNPKTIAVNLEHSANIYRVALNRGQFDLINALIANNIPCTNTVKEYKIHQQALGSTEYSEKLNTWLNSQVKKGKEYYGYWVGDFNSMYHVPEGQIVPDAKLQPFINQSGTISYQFANISTSYRRLDDDFHCIDARPEYYKEALIEKVFSIFLDKYRAENKEDVDILLTFLEKNISNDPVQFKTFYDRVINYVLSGSNKTDSKYIKDILGFIFERPVPEALIKSLNEKVSNFEEKFIQGNRNVFSVESEITPLNDKIKTYAHLFGAQFEITRYFMQIISSEMMSESKSEGKNKIQSMQKLIDYVFNLPPELLTFGSRYHVKNYQEDGLMNKDTKLFFKAPNAKDEQQRVADYCQGYWFNAILLDRPDWMMFLVKNKVPFMFETKNHYWSGNDREAYLKELGPLVFSKFFSPKVFKLFEQANLMPSLLSDESLIRQMAGLQVSQLIEFSKEYNIDLMRQDKGGNTVLHYWAQSNTVKTGWHTIIKEAPSLVSVKNKENKTPIEVQKGHLNKEQGDAFDAFISQKENQALERQTKEIFNQIEKSQKGQRGQAKDETNKVSKSGFSL